MSRFVLEPLRKGDFEYRLLKSGGPRDSYLPVAMIYAAADAKTILRHLECFDDMLSVVESFVDETVDYMTRNNLGDPEKQHNIKWAREVIAKAEGHHS